MLDHPSYMADLLGAVHGPEVALVVRAASCTSKLANKITLVKAALETVRADCKDGEGIEAVVRLPLECKKHAPRADCRGCYVGSQDGEALVEAARNAMRLPSECCLSGGRMRQDSVARRTLWSWQLHTATRLLLLSGCYRSGRMQAAFDEPRSKGREGSASASEFHR